MRTASFWRCISININNNTFLHKLIFENFISIFYNFFCILAAPAYASHAYASPAYTTTAYAAPALKTYAARKFQNYIITLPNSVRNFPVFAYLNRSILKKLTSFIVP